MSFQQEYICIGAPKEALLFTLNVAFHSGRTTRDFHVSVQIENIDICVAFWWKSKFIIKNVSSDF